MQFTDSYSYTMFTHSIIHPLSRGVRLTKKSKYQLKCYAGPAGADQKVPVIDFFRASGPITRSFHFVDVFVDKLG